LGYHLKEDELLGTSVMYGGKEKCMQHFGRETEGNNLEGVGVDGRIILKRT